MHARFLVGPAGSGKTHRCLAEIRAELQSAPDGAPLILIAPKQATFQLERQLLESSDIAGFTRLRIFSFDRLAEFVLKELRIPTPRMLSEQGRVMVLRAVLMQRQAQLKIFRASARLTGFAQQLSLLLREFQHHRLSPARLRSLATSGDAPPLRDKLHDLALLLEGYADWLRQNSLLDADSLLDVATESLAHSGKAIPISGVWLDGFAEMTPQELELLAAFLPTTDRATLAFCIERAPDVDASWLSTWSVVAQTFRRCRARIEAIQGRKVLVETLAHDPGNGRFGGQPPLQRLEAEWSKSVAQKRSASPADASALRIAVCPDPEAEAVLAAREVLDHVRAGGRYRDCAVIVRSLESHHATIDRVFRRYEIPFFMDRRKPMAHHPLAELTRFALRTVAYSWRHDDWFGALKSGLATTDDQEIDRLENAALEFGWEDGAWQKPIPPATPHAASLEEIRQKILPPFARLAAKTGGAMLTGSQLADALEDFWGRLKVGERLDAWSDSAEAALAAGAGESVPAGFHQAVFEQMTEWLKNLALAFPETAMTLREWLPILESGLAGLTVGVIPPAQDQVLVGAVDRSRNPELRLALVCGLNEGLFPLLPSVPTLLTDTDRLALERADVYLGPTSRQRIGHERYLGYIACTRASERLVLTCAAEDARGRKLNPSAFLAHVEQITGVSRKTFDPATLWWDGRHACELAAPLLRGDAPPGLADVPALAPIIGKWRQIEASRAAQVLSPAAVAMLFGNELRTSVSALENFGACPFKFFAATALRLDERKEFEVDARDRGTFHHDVLEEFHRRVTADGGAWRRLDVKSAVELVESIAREKLATSASGKFTAPGAAQFTGTILIERIKRLIAVLIGWMPQYGFDPVACERAFDDSVPDAWPSWRLDLGGGRTLALRGRIDRVDLLRTGADSALVAVMDYKSSARSLDRRKLFNGLELQLLSYLGVLKHLPGPEKHLGAKSVQPAGVFYIPLNGGAGKKSGTRADAIASVKESGSGSFQHRGRFVAEEIAHFDGRAVARGDQFNYARNKDGNLSSRGGDAVPHERLDELRSDIESHLRLHATRILDGAVRPDPFRKGSETACERCDFRNVCRFDPWTQPFRPLKSPPKKSGAKGDDE